MKNSMRYLLAASITTGLVFSSGAEYRIWTDQSGKTIEAEHVRTLDDKVVLKKVDGNEIRVSLDTLKEKDRRYAILLAPPRVEIKVSPKTERENKGIGYNQGPGVQIQKETVQASVNIRKTSSAPYEAPLMSSLYLIGKPEQADGYIILDQTKSKFQFTTENKNEHNYKSGLVSNKQIESGRQMGIEYDGYIAVVRDRTGEIIAMKSSKSAYEKNADAIIGSGKGDVFDADFKPVKREDTKAVRKEENINPMKRRLPGRRF